MGELDELWNVYRFSWIWLHHMAGTLPFSTLVTDELCLRAKVDCGLVEKYVNWIFENAMNSERPATMAMYVSKADFYNYCFVEAINSEVMRPEHRQNCEARSLF